MATKVTFDTENKLIICKAGVTSLSVRIDIYSDAKEDWLSTPALQNFRFPMKVIGGMDTAPGEVAPLYCYLYNGWRLRPDEANHTLKFTDGALLVYEDTTIDPVVDTEGYYNVRVINYVPVQSSLLAPWMLEYVKRMMYNDAIKNGNYVTIKDDEGNDWVTFDTSEGAYQDMIPFIGDNWFGIFAEEAGAEEAAVGNWLTYGLTLGDTQRFTAAISTAAASGAVTLLVNDLLHNHSIENPSLSIETRIPFVEPPIVMTMGDVFPSEIYPIEKTITASINTVQKRQTEEITAHLIIIVSIDTIQKRYREDIDAKQSIFATIDIVQKRLNEGISAKQLITISMINKNKRYLCCMEANHVINMNIEEVNKLYESLIRAGQIIEIKGIEYSRQDKDFIVISNIDILKQLTEVLQLIDNYEKKKRDEEVIKAILAEVA